MQAEAEAERLKSELNAVIGLDGQALKAKLEEESQKMLCDLKEGLEAAIAEVWCIVCMLPLEWNFFRRSINSKRLKELGRRPLR